MAELYLGIGRAEEGVAELDRLWKERPDDLQPARRIVEFLLEQEEFALADSVLKKILVFDDRNAWAWTRLSYVNFRLGEVGRSISLLERASGIEPENAEILSLLGNAYLSIGDRSHALEHFQKAYDLDFRTTDLLYKKGTLENEMDETDRAVETFRELIEAEPENASALNYLGYMLAEADRNLDEAERLLHRALEQDPDNPFFRDSLGWIYYRQGRYESAATELERARDGLGEDTTILEHLADAYHLAGRTEEAKEIYRDLLLLDDGNESARRKLRALEPPND